MKIKTINVLPLQTRVLLEEGLRRKIFSNKIKLAQKLKVNQDTVRGWLSGNHRPTLAQLRKLQVSIPWNKIISLGWQGSLHEIKLPPQLELERIAWLIGVMEGDRSCRRKEGIGIVNQEKSLIKHFLNSMEIFNIKKREVHLRVLINNQKMDKAKISNEFGVPSENITILKTSLKMRSPVFEIRVFNSLLARITEKIRMLLRSIPLRENIIREFVKGFLDAEGCVNDDGSIEAKQKNNVEGSNTIKFISNLLTLLGIRNSMEGPNCENMLILRIWGGKRNAENIKSFNLIIGFIHEQKQTKLRNVLSVLDNNSKHSSHRKP